MLGIAAYGLPLALCARQRGFALAGTSFLLGAGAISLHLFALSLAGVAWTRTIVLVALLPLLIGAIFFARRSAAVSSYDGLRLSPVDLLLPVAIGAYAVFALYAPPYEWDFYGVWGTKARWFFDARGIDWTFLKTNASHPDYPLLLPLLFDFTAIVTGGWNDLAFGWIYVALCASFVLVARGHSTALVALAVAFPAMNLWVGLAEAPVMAFGCAALLFLRRGEYALGAVMLGFAAWSKNEGVALILAAAIALAFVAARRVVTLWPALAIIAPWIVARRVAGLTTDLGRGAVFGRVVERLQDPAGTLQALATAPPDQPYLWLIILAIVLIFVRSAWQRERFLLLALLLQSAALVVPLLATPFDLAGHAQFSLNRIPHQIAPAAAFLAAVLLIRGLSAPSPSAGSPPQPRPSTG